MLGPGAHHMPIEVGSFISLPDGTAFPKGDLASVPYVAFVSTAYLRTPDGCYFVVRGVKSLATATFTKRAASP